MSNIRQNIYVYSEKSKYVLHTVKAKLKRNKLRLRSLIEVEMPLWRRRQWFCFKYWLSPFWKNFILIFLSNIIETTENYSGITSSPSRRMFIESHCIEYKSRRTGADTGSGNPSTRGRNSWWSTKSWKGTGKGWDQRRWRRKRWNKEIN